MLGSFSLLPSPWLNRTIGVDSYNKHSAPFYHFYFLSRGIVCVLVLLVNKFVNQCLLVLLLRYSKIQKKSYVSEISNIRVQEYFWFF